MQGGLLGPLGFLVADLGADAELVGGSGLEAGDVGQPRVGGAGGEQLEAAGVLVYTDRVVTEARGSGQLAGVMLAQVRKEKPLTTGGGSIALT